MKSAQIAKRFLDYFERQGHLVAPSSSLVSTNPTTLFAIAGMVPFIPYLLGEQKPPCPRMASNQKCVRTLDIDEVGKTTRHGTFFQMLGNFSFGDYFKEEAIHYAYELLFLPEEQGGFGFDPSRLWVTTFTDDEEARAIWRNEGFNPEHMQVMGMEDNFWTTGGPGPGGPSSEIFFDRGEEYGPDGGPSASDTRYIEIWNLVFENFEVDQVKSKTDVHIVGELANKNIDTGSGLERLAFVLQGKNNIYETDEVWAVIDKAQQLTGHTYGAVEDDDIKLRIVADHVRSALMMMSDGVRPSNAGRGYVLRRLLRRSILAMRKLGVRDHVLPELFASSRSVMQSSYPEINETFTEVSESAYGEEDAFLRTLDKGIAIFDVAVKKAQKADAQQAQLSGKDAFTLHDTYGFPLELTLEMAEDQGISVDEEGFKAMMSEQKARARADALKKRNAVDLHVYDEIRHDMTAPTAFLGYSTMSSSGRILGIIQEGKGSVQAVTAPAALEVVLDQTPFYAERGGQLPDYGQIITSDGTILEVDDVQSPVKGLIVHHCHLTEGSVALGDKVQASIDVLRRKAIARAHSATHMIHKALREELGPQALQRGSENAPDHLRFDFQWSTAPGEKAMRAVEARVNELIRENLIVNPQEMSYEEAVKLGALHMFGEKYDETVRVVSIGEDGWSRELCGGTHVDRVGRIGMVTILSESSVGSGVRRLDALVGEKAYEYHVKERALISQLSDSLNVPSEDLADRISTVLAKLKDAEKRLAKLQEDALVSQVPNLVNSLRASEEDRLVVAHNFGEISSFDALRKVIFMLREQLGEARPVVILAVGIVEGRVQVAVATNASARDLGLRAGDLVKEASALLGGGGGGKPDFAQGGGTKVEAIEDILAKVEQLAKTA